MANTPQATAVEAPKYPHGLTKEMMLDTDLIPKEKYVTVTIPAEDILGKPHENITINGEVFRAGETHKVNPLLADDIKDRCKAFEHQVKKMFQTNKNEHNKLLAHRTSMGAGFDEAQLSREFGK